MGAPEADHQVGMYQNFLLDHSDLRRWLLDGRIMSAQRGNALLMYLVIAAAALGILATLIYWADQNIATSAGVTKGEANVQTKWDKANKDARDAEATKGTAAATGLETDREKTKVVYRTVTKEVDKIVLRDVYRNACFDVDGVRAANVALSGALTPAAKPDRAVPKPLVP